jgi:anti-sigma B factor antagonist
MLDVAMSRADGERAMELYVREVGDVSVIDLEGNITIGRGDVMLREVVAELLRKERKRIVLNLANVGYMDSAGIGEMVACSKRAHARSGSVRLLNPTEKVQEMLRITRFDRLFETFADEEEAVRSFLAL